jgi:hypothetical protein
VVLGRRAGRAARRWAAEESAAATNPSRAGAWWPWAAPRSDHTRRRAPARAGSCGRALAPPLATAAGRAATPPVTDTDWPTAMRTLVDDQLPLAPIARSSLLRARPYSIAAAAFMVAAIVAALVRAIVPFAHGWWLVAYLLLVGGVAQVLLGYGASPPTRHRSSGARFWLWNAGTVAVAISDLSGAPAGVLAGSLVLLAALTLFARHGARRGPYLLLILFLAGSVLVGCFLGHAFPWH